MGFMGVKQCHVYHPFFWEWNFHTTHKNADDCGWLYCCFTHIIMDYDGISWNRMEYHHYSEDHPAKIVFVAVITIVGATHLELG
jgi:hypothetical protein